MPEPTPPKGRLWLVVLALSVGVAGVGFVGGTHPGLGHDRVGPPSTPAWRVGSDASQRSDRGDILVESSKASMGGFSGRRPP